MPNYTQELIDKKKKALGARINETILNYQADFRKNESLIQSNIQLQQEITTLDQQILTIEPQLSLLKQLAQSLQDNLSRIQTEINSIRQAIISNKKQLEVTEKESITQSGDLQARLAASKQKEAREQLAKLEQKLAQYQQEEIQVNARLNLALEPYNKAKTQYQSLKDSKNKNVLTIEHNRQEIERLHQRMGKAWQEQTALQDDLNILNGFDPDSIQRLMRRHEFAELKIKHDTLKQLLPNFLLRLNKKDQEIQQYIQKRQPGFWRRLWTFLFRLVDRTKKIALATLVHTQITEVKNRISLYIDPHNINPIFADQLHISNELSYFNEKFQQDLADNKQITHQKWTLFPPSLGKLQTHITDCKQLADDVIKEYPQQVSAYLELTQTYNQHNLDHPIAAQAPHQLYHDDPEYQSNVSYTP